MEYVDWLSLGYSFFFGIGFFGIIGFLKGMWECREGKYCVGDFFYLFFREYKVFVLGGERN